MNEQNLIPNEARTPTERRENARKAGLASGKARRDRRNFRETLAEILAMPDKDKNGQPLISPVTGKPMSIRESLVMQALLSARKGNVKALQTILDVMGERTFKVESDVTVKTDKYDNMTDEELQAEAKRISESIVNL